MANRILKVLHVDKIGEYVERDVRVSEALLKLCLRGAAARVLIALAVHEFDDDNILSSTDDLVAT